MTSTVRDVMSTNLRTLDTDATARQAATIMRDSDIGDVIVLGADGALRGIVTDRDLVVRCVAEGADPDGVALGDLCHGDVVTVGPDDGVDTAVVSMREHAVRRLPVCDGDDLVGIVSLGDLAEEFSRNSALGEISAAPPNN